MAPLPGWTVLLLAPFAGSFAAVLAMRLPEGRPVGWARSCCDRCGAVLGAAELVPLFSFLVQRGRCRHCGARIDPAHPLMELAALLVALAGWLAVGADPAAVWGGCVLGWCGLALGRIDLRCLRLPDGLTLPLLLAGLGFWWWRAPELLADRALAAALGYGAFEALALGYRRLRGRDGLGAGDAKLLAAGGAWTGLAMLPVLVLAAALLTLAAVLGRVLWSRVARNGAGGPALRADAAVPFGPGLAAASWLCWLWQNAA